MTPFFNPGPNRYGKPRIFLAAVGNVMTEVAGEVADGLICHGFTTRRYFDEVTRPALERGRAKVGRTLDGFEISGPMFVVTGRERRWPRPPRACAADRLLRLHARLPAGARAARWGELQDELNRLSKEGRWGEMGDLVDDEVLNTFAVVAPIDEVADALRERWGGALTRLSFYAPYETDDDRWDAVMASLKSA